MKKSKILSYILLFAIISAMIMPSSAMALNDPPLSSKAVVLVDIGTGNVLFEKNADEKIYPASTTKIMTVLLAVEAIEAGKVSLTDSVTAQSSITTALGEDGSSAGIVVGETMSLESVLYCAMLSSANEACNMVASYISGDIPSFVKLMNERALELGCTGTNFRNTHGYPDYNHYSTARDMALIALEAYSHPLFMEICNTITKTIPATNMSEARVIGNTNGLINNDSELYPGYYYEYAKGIKTGHTNDAGYCLISSASKDKISLLCVVMGGMAVEKVEKTDYTNFSDSISTYNWAFENFSYRNIIDTTDLVKDIPVKMAKDTDYVTVRPETAVQALMPNDEDNSSFDQQLTIYSEQEGKDLVAPIEAGTVLGEITISRDGVIYGSSELVACSSVDLDYAQFIGDKIVKTLKNPLVIIFIVIILGLLLTYAILVARYRRSKKQYKKELESRRRVKENTLSERQASRNLSSKGSGSIQDGTAATNGTGSDRSASGTETVSKAEQDYFDEFFGRNKK